MTKIYLTGLLLIASVAFTKAQNFILTPEQHRVDTVLAENFEAYDINMSTPNPEAITYKWALISNSMPASWSYSLCDEGSCYVGIPSSSTMSPITLAQSQAGAYGFLKINLTVGLNYGSGLVVFYVYDQNDINRGDTISFEIHWPAPTGIAENNSLANFETYPNPAINTINLENNSGENIHLSMIDVNGSLITDFDMQNGNRLTKDVALLPRGIYLILAESASGLRSTQRIILE